SHSREKEERCREKGAVSSQCRHIGLALSTPLEREGRLASQRQETRMAAQDARQSLVALTRFGLGVRPGELAGIGNHARDFVLAQLTGDAAGRVAERLP